MIRTINEQYRAFKRLRELATKAPIHRKRLLQLAKTTMALAKLQLRNPDLRPKSRLSANQYRAIAEHLLAGSNTATRGRMFAAMAEIAEWKDWPSSAVAPFQVLTKDESAAIWNGVG